MGTSRIKAREHALQALFYMDVRQNASEEAISLYAKNFSLPKDDLPFFLELVKGVLSFIAEIDAVIERFSENWKMSRMSCVDRNAMRIAVYEMLYRDDIPAKVSINEAINLGKDFGNDESGAFINGILDSIRLAIENREIQKVKIGNRR